MLNYYYFMEFISTGAALREGKHKTISDNCVLFCVIHFIDIN